MIEDLLKQFLVVNPEKCIQVLRKKWNFEETDLKLKVDWSEEESFHQRTEWKYFPSYFLLQVTLTLSGKCLLHDMTMRYMKKDMNYKFNACFMFPFTVPSAFCACILYSFMLIHPVLSHFISHFLFVHDFLLMIAFHSLEVLATVNDAWDAWCGFCNLITFV